MWLEAELGADQGARQGSEQGARLGAFGRTKWVFGVGGGGIVYLSLLCPYCVRLEMCPLCSWRLKRQGPSFEDGVEGGWEGSLRVGEAILRGHMCIFIIHVRLIAVYQ